MLRRLWIIIAVLLPVAGQTFAANPAYEYNATARQWQATNDGVNWFPWLISASGTSPLTLSASGNVVGGSMTQAGASSNGWLSSTDWRTFNGKQPAGAYVTGVTGTAPITSSGGTTPAIGVSVDGSTIDASGTGTSLEIKPGGITGSQISTSATPQVARIGLGEAADATAPLSVLLSGLGSSVVGAVHIDNTTASTSSATVQYSPAIRFSGSAWNTGTLASNTNNWLIYSNNISGNPTTSRLLFSDSLNGGTYNSIWGLDSHGYMFLYGNSLATTPAYVVLYYNGTAATSLAPVQMSPSACWYGSAWNSNASASEAHYWYADILPTTAAGATSSMWRLGWALNGGVRSNVLTVSNTGTLALPLVGGGLSIKEGSNARMGVATLVGGTIAVSNTSVTASTRILLTVQTVGGTQGLLSTARVAGTSFTINSTSGTDTSTVAWLLIEPS